MADADLIALPGDWALWRWACLRSAGFPASLVLRLGSAELAAAVDALHAAERATVEGRNRLRAERRIRRKATRTLGEGSSLAGDAPQDPAPRIASEDVESLRAAAAARYGEALLAAGEVLREVASEPRFHEAVTWQNGAAASTALDPLARTDVASVSSRDRYRQNLVVNYLHRYCVKNDTIGFFGPVAWVRLAAGGDRVAVKPGPTLLATRNVYFEQWPIDALARAIASDPRWRPWLSPRRYGFIRQEGLVVHSPISGKSALTAPEATVLAACDGLRTARQIVDEVGGDGAETVYEILERLRARKIISWQLECPTSWEPNRALRARLERIAEPTLQAEGLAALRTLEDAAAGVAAAAGDSLRLPHALEALDETFTRLTGTAPTRHAGAMYAARGLVFEDCRRDVDLALGPQIIEEIGPPLCLVLASSRWLTCEAGRAYDVAFRDLFRKISRGSSRAPLADFWFRAQRLIMGAKERPLDDAVRELGRRWDAILGPPADPHRVNHATAALSPRVRAAFGQCGQSWATHHSPDILLAASSVDALARGDYYAVLGEMHVALNTLETNCLARQHPSFDELAAMRCSARGPRVAPVANKDSPRVGSVRSGAALRGPDDYEIEVGFDPSGLAPSQVLRLGDLYVEEGEAGLTVTDPCGGARLSLMTVMSGPLGVAVVNALTLGSKLDHAPRLTFDRLVVRRESWSFPASLASFARAGADFTVFAEARRWAGALGLPRFVFVRSPLEVKPIFVDFESPIGVRVLARIVRQMQDHPSSEPAPLVFSISEMLPTIEEAWLPDATGQRFAAEIRIAVEDRC